MEWLNPPRVWRQANDRLEVVTDDRTDFWRETFYGWTNDNGHCYLEKVRGDFTAEVTFGAQYAAHYDHAGLMLRVSERVWIKGGVEHAHGVTALGTVLTRGQSDWAIGPLVGIADEIRLRVTRRGAAVCFQWAPAGGDAPYQTLRLGALSDEADAWVGPMACSPTRAGLEAHFAGFRVLPPVDFAAEV